MAEFVEYRIEKILPELEQMLRVNLYTRDEIRTLSKKRKTFEHKIERHTKIKEDYMNYIDFEVNLLKNIRLRRDKYGIMQKKDVIEYAIARRVNKLYKQAIYRFQEHVKIWLAYIKFCKNFGFTEAVSQILGRMLQVHGDKPRLWYVAAKWELDEMNSTENARQFLLRGLHFHPKNELLYTEVFKLELEDSKLKNPPQTTQAIVVYESALKNMDNVEFIISILNIAENFDFTHSLQRKIVQNLMEQYPKEEIMWHCIAQRELKGFHYDTPDGVNEPKNPRERIKLSIDVYESAINLLKTPKMWGFYVDAMLDLNKDTKVLSKYKRNILGNALEAAHETGCMSEQHYIQWQDLLKNCDGTQEKILEIFKIATEKYPLSLDLWQKYIHYYISLENENGVKSVFYDANKNLGDKSLPVWRQLLMYYQIGSDSLIKVEEFFCEALTQPSSISGPLKPLFLEWLALQKGINAARSKYLKIASTPPFCLDLHTQMSSLESLQIPVSAKPWRKCNEYATQQFGKINTDVWINYIKFELEHGTPLLGSNLYTRAIATLESKFIDSFETEYSQIKNGINKPGSVMEMS